MVSTTRPGPNTAQEPEKPGDYVQTGENQGLREGWSRERERQKDHARQRDQKFLVFGRVLITFHNLEDGDNPFAFLIDEGTVELFQSSDYFDVDVDHERVFKSLLRFSLQ